MFFGGMKMQLLAPVGNRSMLTAAVKVGADAVYFGIKNFNMRAAANNFSLEEVKEVVDYCHQNKVKAYCTVNIIVYEKELEQLNKILQTLKETGIDAVICWDFAVIDLCETLKIPVHLSTQASLSNFEAIKSLKSKFKQIKRVILARECSLEDIKEIKGKISKENLGVEIETFIHGARCISLSGRCFMSQELFGKSANRGECLQPCRREYKVIDKETGKEMDVENNFIMSSKDLCALPLLPQLVSLGIDSFKIEGRNRGADYVHKVVFAYKRAMKAIESDEFNEELIERLTEQLKQAYNKDFSRGYFADYSHHQRADAYGNKATTKKLLLGKVKNFYNKISVAEIKVESEGFSVGENLAFIGPTTGLVETLVEEIHNITGRTEKAKKGEVVAVKVDSKVRENDMVYLVKERR